MMRVIVCFVVALNFAASICYAGDLNPPPGPVLPTMKTLDDVNPSTPVQSLPAGSNSTHIITQPGHYHLTDNITTPGPNRSAIRIAAPGVVLDLNGFTISGVATETLAAIVAIEHATIRNGLIIAWGMEGILSTQPVVVEDMRFISIEGRAIQAFSSASIQDCQFTDCAQIEVGTGSFLHRCLMRDMPTAVASPGADGVSITDTIMEGTNTSDPGCVIELGNHAKLQNVTVLNNGRSGLKAGSFTTVITCQFSGIDTGTNNGVSVGVNSIIKDCSVRNYGGTGIIASSVSIVSGNSVSTNDLNGIQLIGSRNIADGNNVSTAGEIGILTTGQARITNNMITSCGSHAIEVFGGCTITGNTLVSETIRLTGGFNSVDSNTNHGLIGTALFIEGNDNRISRNSIGGGVSDTGFGNLVFPVRTNATLSSAGPWDNFQQ